jgi:hypothetical protein
VKCDPDAGSELILYDASEPWGPSKIVHHDDPWESRSRYRRSIEKVDRIYHAQISGVSAVPLKVEQVQLDTGLGARELVAEVGKTL